MIQIELLPKELDLPAGWRVATHYQPARDVGGDFYDVIQVSEDQVALVIGDARTKGIPAALVMATTTEHPPQ